MKRVVELLWCALLVSAFMGAGASAGLVRVQDAPVKTGEVIEIKSRQEFTDLVEHVDKPVLIDFNAPWCPACQIMRPAVQQIASKTKDELVVVSINVDEFPDLAAAFGVTSIPAFVMADAKGVIKRGVVGAIDENTFRTTVGETLAIEHVKPEKVAAMVLASQDLSAGVGLSLGALVKQSQSGSVTEQDRAGGAVQLRWVGPQEKFRVYGNVNLRIEAGPTFASVGTIAGGYQILGASKNGERSIAPHVGIEPLNMNYGVMGGGGSGVTGYYGWFPMVSAGAQLTNGTNYNLIAAGRAGAGVTTMSPTSAILPAVGAGLHLVCPRLQICVDWKTTLGDPSGYNASVLSMDGVVKVIPVGKKGYVGLGVTGEHVSYKQNADTTVTADQGLFTIQLTN
jgi:thioredoxin 1